MDTPQELPYTIFDQDIDVMYDAVRTGLSHAFEPDFDAIEKMGFVLGTEITDRAPTDLDPEELAEELERLDLLVLEVRIAPRVGDAPPDVELVTIINEWPTWMNEHVPQQRVFKIGVMDAEVDAAALMSLKKLNKALEDVLLSFGPEEDEDEDEDSEDEDASEG